MKGGSSIKTHELYELQQEKIMGETISVLVFRKYGNHSPPK